MRCTIKDPASGNPIRLQIDFHKRKREIPSKRGREPRELIDTLCILYELSPNGMKNTLAEAESILNPLDTYNKRVGKKIALQRLLKGNFSDVILDGKEKRTRTWAGLFSTKENRTLVWKAFEDTFKRWR